MAKIPAFAYDTLIKTLLKFLKKFLDFDQDGDVDAMDAYAAYTWFKEQIAKAHEWVPNWDSLDLGGKLAALIAKFKEKYPKVKDWFAVLAEALAWIAGKL